MSDNPHARMYADELAARRGVSVQAARDWLRRTRANYGPSVVGQDGRRLYTTAASIARVQPDEDEPVTLAQLRAQLDNAMGFLRAIASKVGCRVALDGGDG